LWRYEELLVQMGRSCFYYGHSDFYT